MRAIPVLVVSAALSRLLGDVQGSETIAFVISETPLSDWDDTVAVSAVHVNYVLVDGE